MQKFLFYSNALQQSLSREICVNMFEISSLYNFTGMCLIGFLDKCLVDDIKRVGQIEVDRTEVSIRDFRKFVEMNNFVTKAKG